MYLGYNEERWLAGCGRTHVTSLLSVLPVIDVVSVNVAGDRYLVHL